VELARNRITVRHVLNWGGFVNDSFTIDDGTDKYHLKLTDDVESIGKLRAWYEIHSLLERRYRAPHVINWLDFPEIGFAGLLQEHINGRTARFCENPLLVEQLIQLVNCLHQDADLGARLNSGRSSAKTCLDHFVETYIHRFTADLEAIGDAPPSFVSSALLQWMRQETERLRERADSDPAFHRPADQPVHGDLNEGNVLVTPAEFFILDWDDLAIGDPGVDFAVLLWPMVSQGRSWRDFFTELDDAFSSRIEVCLRAQLLDEVIDPLADFVAADAVPSRQAEVQLVKRTQHQDALERYERSLGFA
jgi:hypothetical protein